MLNTIRYKIAIYLAKRSAELIEKGDFKSIMKGLDYLEASIRIVPPSEALSKFGDRLRETAEAQKQKIEDQG